MVDTLVRGVLHPPRSKEIPSSGADAIRPRRGDGTGISQWESSIEIRLGIAVVGGENAIQRQAGFVFGIPVGIAVVGGENAIQGHGEFLFGIAVVAGANTSPCIILLCYDNHASPAFSE